MTVIEKEKKLSNNERVLCLKMAVAILENAKFDSEYDDEKNCCIGDLVSLIKQLPAEH